MNKKLSIIIILLAVLFVSQSCKKEEAVKQNDVTKHKEFLSTSQASTITLIKKFMSQLANPSTEDQMSIEDVVWYIEATLNYKYAHIEKVNYSDYISGNMNKKYSLNPDGYIDFSQVKDLYDEFENQLSIEFAKIKSDDKWLIIVDIDYDNINLSMFYAFGDKKVSLVKQAPYWADWYYGEDLGKCNGGGVPSDAANEIDKELRVDFIANHPYHPETRWIANSVIYPGPAIPGGYPFQFSLINPTDITPQDNKYDYILFYCYEAWPNYHTCMSSDEMDFYYNGAVHLISTLEGFYPNREVVNLKLSDAKMQGHPYTLILHGLDTRFGNWVHVLNDNTYTL